MSLPILDHFAILVSYQTLQTVTQSLKDSLLVIDGGAHADGLTVNKLIHLADGTYLEFIAFVEGVDPEKRRAHRWGNLEEGKIADWAHTLPSEADYAQLQKRVADAGNGVTYGDLTSLQRHRPDGVLMKCLVSVALNAEGRCRFGVLMRRRGICDRHSRRRVVMGCMSIRNILRMPEVYRKSLSCFPRRTLRRTSLFTTLFTTRTLLLDQMATHGLTTSPLDLTQEATRSSCQLSKVEMARQRSS
ncbi:hypothetical protein FOQG_08274 [Fusarium oxysporum f. sp. raphani 54005]|uniref:Glyoxalase-like domain-containing protein n=1 Tax=Fusarium oxysporum f. sp. raphani 54005 TaxID=1089458 RepID=X0C2R7_FUSOX|nr:hypothetical protein FOQG_08274 [Fusarium oxysporum f. sp. raphani 54005]